MSNEVISVKNLHKSYNSETKAVNGVSLHVAQGEIFALLGPNGAGKTTTTEILEGYRKWDKGEVTVLGYNPSKGEKAFKARIGIVLQSTGVEQYLTVAEAIELYRNMYPHPRDLDEIVELVQLKEKRNVRVNRLSGGQRRKLDVGVALAGDPDVLFLDEPTEGFDPSARRNAWQIIKDLASLGKTIFLTTHYMDEAEYLADRLAIIANGRIVAEGTPKNLGGRQDEQSTIRFRAIKNGPNLPKDLAVSAKKSGDFIELVTKKSVESLNTLTGWAIKNNLKLESLEVSQPSLEDVYLKITSQAKAKNG